jgi:hypothetical protein
MWEVTFGSESPEGAYCDSLNKRLFTSETAAYKAARKHEDSEHPSADAGWINMASVRKK